MGRLLQSSFYGSQSASLRAIQRNVDMNHKEEVPLSCEGKCSEKAVIFTPHVFAAEIRHDWRTYTQNYACKLCGCVRRFGMTHTQVTRKGESN